MYPKSFEFHILSKSLNKAGVDDVLVLMKQFCAEHNLICIRHDVQDAEFEDMDEAKEYYGFNCMEKVGL